MTVTTSDRGQQNVFAKEPEMYYENYGLQTSNQIKEIVNSRWAIIGVTGAIISYTFTGKLFFGIF